MGKLSFCFFIPWTLKAPGQSEAKAPGERGKSGECCGVGVGVGVEGRPQSSRECMDSEENAGSWWSLGDNEQIPGNDPRWGESPRLGEESRILRKGEASVENLLEVLGAVQDLGES